MARKKSEPTGPETITERVDRLLKLSGGQCPYGMVVYSKADYDEAVRVIKSKRGAAKLVIPRLEEKDAR